jgi:hypothetical protein
VSTSWPKGRGQFCHKLLPPCFPGLASSRLDYQKNPYFIGAPETIRTSDLCLRRADACPKQISAPPGTFAVSRPLMMPRTSGSKRGPPSHKRSCYLYAVYP